MGRARGVREARAGRRLVNEKKNGIRIRPHHAKLKGKTKYRGPDHGHLVGDENYGRVTETGAIVRVLKLPDGRKIIGAKTIKKYLAFKRKQAKDAKNAKNGE